MEKQLLIIKMYALGSSQREIAKTLKVSRWYTARKVLDPKNLAIRYMEDVGLLSRALIVARNKVDFWKVVSVASFSLWIISGLIYLHSL